MKTQTWKSWNMHYGHVLSTSLVDLLDAGDREADDQVDLEEHDANYQFDSFDDE